LSNIFSHQIASSAAGLEWDSDFASIAVDLSFEHSPDLRSSWQGLNRPYSHLKALMQLLRHGSWGSYLSQSTNACSAQAKIQISSTSSSSVCANPLQKQK